MLSEDVGEVVTCASCLTLVVTIMKFRITTWPSSLVPGHVHLPARNGLVNEVEFLGLITQNE